MSSSTGQGDMGSGDMGQDLGQQGATDQGNAGMSSTNTGDTGDGSPTSSTSSATTTQTAGNPSQNLQYDLISTIYHAHKSSSSVQQYIADATSAGNDQAAQFFQMVAQEDQQRAQRAQDLLTQLGNTSGGASTGMGSSGTTH